MHTSTFGQFLIGALIASSAVAFQVSTFVRVGSAVALALPVRAAPVFDQGTTELETRHHKGKRTRKNNKREEVVEIEARHHKGKRTRKNNKRDVSVGDLETRSELEVRHHKGKRTRKNNKRQNSNLTDTDGGLTDNDNGLTDNDLTDSENGARAPDLQARHHKGKRTRKNNKRDVSAAVEHDEDDDEGHEVEKRHHKGKRTRKNNKRHDEDVEDADHEDEDEDVGLEKRHHKGKRVRGGQGN